MEIFLCHPPIWYTNSITSISKDREWVAIIVGEIIASVTCMARTGLRDLHKDEDFNTADVKNLL